MPARHYYPLSTYFHDAQFLNCDPNTPFQGFCHDSRLINEGELFVAFQGLNDHGYSFKDQALARGAVAVIVDTSCGAPLTGPTIVVPDLMAALIKAATIHRSLYPGRLYAVTGTAGKTSTKEYFAQICQQIAPGAPFFISHGNWNNTLGLVINLSRLPLCPLYNLFELGINGPGDMDQLVDILRPNAVLITSIGEAHLERLENCHGVAREKTKIARYADKAWTTPEALRYFEKQYITWETVPAIKDMAVELLKEDLIGTQLHLDGRSVMVYSTGVFHQQNFLLALIAFQSQMGGIPHLSLNHFFITVPKGRGNLERWGSWYILNDTYNASIPSLRYLLDFLQKLASQQKVGLVLSDFSELGGQEAGLLDAVLDSDSLKNMTVSLYYTGYNPKIWLKRGAMVFDPGYEGVRSCFEHARQQGIRLMAFKAARKSALEAQLDFFIQNIQSSSDAVSYHDS